MVTVTVIDVAGTTRTFKADGFSVDDDGVLRVTGDRDVIAVFRGPAWHVVFNEEAST
jgi:hypothetical protein